MEKFQEKIDNTKNIDPNEVIFDIDKMFDPLAIDPEKLSENDKRKYRKLN